MAKLTASDLEIMRPTTQPGLGVDSRNVTILPVTFPRVEQEYVVTGSVAGVPTRGLNFHSATDDADQ